MDKMKTCCFFGHRHIEETDILKTRLYEEIEALITTHQVETFLFGSKSEFDKLCLKIVTELKEKYPHIQRVYVRAEFPYISDHYRSYLLQSYEDTYFPDSVLNAGKASYVKRNIEMIDNSQFCIVYLDEQYAPPRKKAGKRDVIAYQPKSGTKTAYDYAMKKHNHVINMFE